MQRRSRAVLAALGCSLMIAGAAHAQLLSAARRIPAPDDGVPFGGALALRNGRLAVGKGPIGGRAGVAVYDFGGAVYFAVGSPNNDPTDEFGSAVAWVGDDLLVGAPQSDVAGTDRGAAFRFDGTDGTLLHTLTRPDALPTSFGYEVAGLADDALVGASGPLGPNGEGVFRFDGATGAHVDTFLDPDGGTTEAGRFGETIVVDGNDVFISSPYGDGASEVYRFDATGTLQQTYVDPEPGDQDEFGRDVAVSGTHLAVGVGTNGGGGKVYLFDVASGALEHTYVSPYVSDSLFFGQAVAGIGGRVAVGSNRGVFVYETTPPYDLVQEIFAPGEFADDHDAFGRALASDGLRLAVGATGSVTIFDLCGNGIRSDREECDDGNWLDGDGCSASCRLETCGAGPAPGCTVAGKSSIAIRQENSIYHQKDALKWTWAGPGTDPALFGDPLAGASLTLCVYDHTEGPNPRLRVQSTALTGGFCGLHACWKSSPGGFAYGDKAHTPSGIERLTVKKAGAATKAQVIAKGAETGLPPSAFDTVALDGTVTVQLRSSASAACLTSDFPLPATLDKKHTYKDKTD